MVSILGFHTRDACFKGGIGCFIGFLGGNGENYMMWKNFVGYRMNGCVVYIINNKCVFLGCFV